MNIFEVQCTNLDARDGIFSYGLFSTIEKAIDCCKQYVEEKRGVNIKEDFNGKFSQFRDKSLKYSPCEDKPAIYYTSYYGNYRCVVYIETRIVK
jgi:hypothetical protein